MHRHRDLFRRVWKHKSKRKQGQPPLTDDIVALIKRIVEENLTVNEKLSSHPVLSGLHHDYYWLAEECIGQGRGQPQAHFH